MKLAFKI